jgi:hypothetical protein
MNKYFPQRLPGGWYMVGEGRLMERRKVGYCRSQCSGHRSPEEAHAHFIDFLLDNRLELHPRGRPHATCEFENCTNKTESTAVIAQTYTFWLCPQHLTREAVETLFRDIGQPMLLQI